MPTARLLGSKLRALAGGVEVPVEGDTIGAALRDLVAGADARVGEMLFEGDALSRDARILKNGQNVLRLSGLETPLVERDVLTVYFFGARSVPGG